MLSVESAKVNIDVHTTVLGLKQQGLEDLEINKYRSYLELKQLVEVLILEQCHL